jgi:DMSO/TMAO reductase YedYZ molybdopterin-dependent catalytic subunit
VGSVSPSGMAPERSASRSADAVAGVVVAAFAVAAGHLAAALVAPGSSPAVAVGQATIALTPEWLKSFAIAAFGTWDKLALGIGMAIVIGLIAAWIGVASVSRPWLAKASLVGLAAIGALAAVTRPPARPSWILPSAVAGAAGLIAYGWLQGRSERMMGAPREAAREARGPHALDRRTFVRGIVTVGGAAAAAAVAGSFVSERRFGAVDSRARVALPSPVDAAPTIPPGADLGIEGLTPYMPPTTDFYRIDTALFPPQVRSETWELRIHGMVDREITLTYDDLVGRDLVERDVTLSCVSNEVGGPYVGNARWTGVLLAPLLEEAGIHSEADQLVSRSADGMTIGTPTAAVMDGRDAMLAVGMNGEPLPIDHGFPVRMVVPGLYGYVSATKWVVEIEATTFGAYDAYWIERGWAEEPPPIETTSRIDTPRGDVTAGTVAVAGIAWAPHRGIERVEVRVDGGEWHDAELADVPSVDTWRQWVYRWQAASGTHRLEVRATDGDGVTQTEERTPPFPDGSTGWHSVTVNVS